MHNTLNMGSKTVLEEAARCGKLDVLENLLKEENPSILADFRLKSLGESLLHIATKSGQLYSVRLLMKMDPCIAAEINKDGFRALDIAVIMGNLGIVKELILSFNQGLCLLKGKDQRTALHYAAMKGRVDVIDELLDSCPDCIEDVTAHGETGLHLAVRSHQFHAFAALVEWIRKICKESIINMGDGDGNTVLHNTVLMKQLQFTDLLLDENSATRRVIEVNARNTNGSTPLDLLDIQDSYDIKIKQKLESAGAIRSPHSVSLTSPELHQQQRIFKPNDDFQPKDSSDWFKYFKFQKQRDSPSDARNVLLVVSVLLATVCFQAGVNPPNGILNKAPQPQPQPNTRNPNTPPPAYNPALVSGLASASGILGSHATSYLFLFANSLGLTASTCILIYLTAGFPFKRELHIALYSMMFTYGFAISAIIKELDRKNETMAYLLVTIAIVLPFVLRWLPRWGRKAWKHWRSRDVRKSSIAY